MLYMWGLDTWNLDHFSAKLLCLDKLVKMNRSNFIYRVKTIWSGIDISSTVKHVGQSNFYCYILQNSEMVCVAIYVSKGKIPMEGWASQVWNAALVTKNPVCVYISDSVLRWREKDFNFWTGRNLLTNFAHAGFCGTLLRQSLRQTPKQYYSFLYLRMPELCGI